MPATPPPEPDVPGADPGPLGGVPIALAPATFARHAAAVNWVEQQNRSRTPRAGRGRPPWANGAALARVTTALAAAAGAAYGSGTGVLQKDTGTMLADDADSVTLKSLAPVPVAVGTILPVVWALGSWWALPTRVPVCRGVTTGAVSAATFGGADGSGPVTITYPDGTTASITAYNRATAAAATGKNCLLTWVPELARWYGLFDC